MGKSEMEFWGNGMLEYWVNGGINVLNDDS